jgi:hypothetical protein
VFATCGAGEEKDYLDWFINLDSNVSQDVSYVLSIRYYKPSSGEYFSTTVDGTIPQGTSSGVSSCSINGGGRYVGPGYFVVSTCVLSIGGGINAGNFAC